VELFLQTLALGLLSGAVLALAASGLTLIFGVMNVINVAHGAFLILAAFISWSLWSGIGLDPLLGVPVVAAAMFVVGGALYGTTLKWIEGAPVSMTVILTFAIAILLEGVMGLIWGNQAHSATPSYFAQSFHVEGIALPKAQVYGAAVAVVVLGGLHLLIARTWLGRAIRAASVNPSGARLTGVNVTRVAGLTFAIGVATAGAAGAIISVLSPFLPGSHAAWVSRVLGVIVLGGMGSLPGAVIGALLLGVAEAMTSTYVSLQWALAVPYIVIFAVLLLRPQGILGARLREDVA
jgi:branched-chain amino acid transport system permease protein